MRRFDGHRLAAQIKAMLAEFKQGTTRPPSASATTAPSPPVRACSSRCTALGHVGGGAAFPAAQQEGSNKICTDWEAIGLLVSRPRFRAAQPAPGLGSRYDINVITFGARADGASRLHRPEVEVHRRGFALDEWQTVDHSVSGFRVQRKHPGSASSTTRWSASSPATAASTCWARSAG